jgi:hypothetical protein
MYYKKIESSRREELNYYWIDTTLQSSWKVL